MTDNPGDVPAERQEVRGRVRAAGPDDAPAIGRLHVRAWQATYRGIMPDDFLDGLDPIERGHGWARTLTAADPGRSRLVVCVDSDTEPVGVASVGPARGAEGTRPGLGELYSINLDPDVWGLGLGRALLRGATTELSRLGFHEAVLWVAGGNVRARRFYEAAGWAADGTEKTDDSHGPPVEEMRYHRLIPPGGPQKPLSGTLASLPANSQRRFDDD